MRSRSCTIAAALLALSVATPASLGQAALPTQFTLRQLERQPGTILISPGYMTIIEFPEAATRATSGNPALIKVQPRKGSSVVEMTAAKMSGQTDLLVTTGGKIVMFVIKIDPEGKAPRRYTVTGQSAPALPEAARPVAPPLAAIPAPRPAVATPSTPVAATPSNRYEAEAAILYRADTLKLAQASGGAIAEHINRDGSRVTFPAVRVARSGSYTLRVHYANGYSGLAVQTLLVNSLAAPDVRYPPTGTWENISSVDVAVTLRAGLNTLRFGRGQSGQGESVATLDVIEVLTTGSAPAPQAKSAPVQSTPVSSGSGASSIRRAIPVPNGGFEKDLVGWSPWINDPNDVAQNVGTRQAHGGSGYLVLSSTKPQKQNIGQTITGLSSGTYTMEMWIRTSGGQDGLILFALDYGGKELNAGVPPKAEPSTWVKYSIPNIKVTDGKATIGIFMATGAGNYWAHVDDVALYREADQP